MIHFSCFHFKSAILCCAIMCASSFGAVAQSVSADQLTKILGQSNAGPMVTALQKQNALNIDARQQIPGAFDFPSSALQVEFSDASALLTVGGMTVLREVAIALQHERLSGQRFQIAAHYVSSNDPASALRISAKRAQSVVEHLVVFYNIPRSNLIPVGYGANKPADQANITSPLNTRIELINVLDL